MSAPRLADAPPTIAAYLRGIARLMDEKLPSLAAFNPEMAERLAEILTDLRTLARGVDNAVAANEVKS